MAELYIAHQRGAAGFSKIVALKRILPHLAEDPTFTKMFLDEARLASDLQHPNLAHVLDFGEYDGEHFLTMEYVHGRNLLQLLKAAKGTLSLACALQIVVAVARGLHDLHDHCAPDGRVMGLVHRDVSPANVLVAHDGTVKLTDFGIAKAMGLTSATRTGTFKGKLGHSSPEQARGEEIDRRSDVFCLGILLYEVTTGVRAFAGPNEFAVLGKVARGDYVPPNDVVPEYPAGLATIVARALKVDVDARYPTAASVADAVEEFARALDVHLGGDAVAATMLQHFGPAPPIVDGAELELGAGSVELQPAIESSMLQPATRRPMLLYAAVPMALLVGAVGMWLVQPTEAADSKPQPPSERAESGVASPDPVSAQIPSHIEPLEDRGRAEDPALRRGDDGLEPAVPEPTPAATTRPAKRKRRRRSKKRKKAPAEPTTSRSKGSAHLYPPDR